MTLLAARILLNDGRFPQDNRKLHNLDPVAAELLARECWITEYEGWENLNRGSSLDAPGRLRQKREQRNLLGLLGFNSFRLWLTFRKLKKAVEKEKELGRKIS